GGPAAGRAPSRPLTAAAGAVEHEFLAHPEEGDALDLEREARPALARISELIVARAADLTADPGALASLDPERVAESLDGSLAPAPHRRAIASAIRHLTASRAPESGRCEGRAPRPPAGGRRAGAQLAMLATVTAGR